MTSKWEDPLEGLLTEALASAPLAAKKRKGGMEATRHERAFFTNPENWNLNAQVQLVHTHENVETLIGLFDEFLHTLAPDARRLVACTTRRLDKAVRVERVTGTHWLGDELSELKRQPTVLSVPLIVPIDLSMGQLLHAAPVLATAHLSHGGMTRLTLDEATIFEGRTPREILSLPKGIDVLEGLSGECKRNVWAAVNIEMQNGEEAT